MLMVTLLSTKEEICVSSHKTIRLSQVRLDLFVTMMRKKAGLVRF